jgi:hypothetical protein
VDGHNIRNHGGEAWTGTHLLLRHCTAQHSPYEETESTAIAMTTSRQRLVRFRDFLPPSIIDEAVSADAEPLFSPTLHPPSKLLHSIFSPTKGNHGSESQRSFLLPPLQFQQQQLPVTRTPQSQSARNNNRETTTSPKTQHNTKTAAIPRGEQDEPSIYSSVVKPHQQSPSMRNVTTIFVSPSHTALSSLAVSMDADLFSPYSTKTTREDESKSQKTHLSQRSTTTAFRTLEKMEWLTVDYITTCESVSQLVRIITVLEDAAYPSLLRAAQERLSALHSDPCLSPNSVLVNLSSTSHNEDDVCPSGNNTTQSSSSLIMSISTDNEESHNNQSTTFHKSFLSAPSVAHSIVAKPSSFQGFSATEQQLWEQVQRLTQTIAEMEQTGADDFYQQLLLPDPSKEAAAELEKLQEHTDVEELLQSIEQLRERNRNLQEQIQRQTTDREQKLQHSAAVEKRLSTELQELEAQLAMSTATSKAAEQHFHRQHAHLHQLLSATQANLQRIQADRDALIQCLLQAVGRDKDGGVRCSA